jgi:hypothetical protein
LVNQVIRQKENKVYFEIIFSQKKKFKNIIFEFLYFDEKSFNFNTFKPELRYLDYPFSNPIELINEKTKNYPIYSYIIRTNSPGYLKKIKFNNKLVNEIPFESYIDLNKLNLFTYPGITCKRINDIFTFCIQPTNTTNIGHITR